MSKAPESVPAGGRVAFQVDGFQLGRGNRCEVQGRWTGVRGRRFMRPALTLVVGGQRVRLLADLEQKPWAAEDGQPWLAEFACEFDAASVQEAELTVAPDITVSLPLGRGNAGGTKRSRSGAPVTADAARSPISSGKAVASAATPETPVPTREKSTQAQLGELRDERRRLRDEVERLGSETAGAEARTVKLTARLEQLTNERDLLREALDQARRESEEARVTRDRMAADLDAARRERAEALESDQAARDRAQAERNTALTIRDHALAERDAAMAVRDQVLGDRDKLARSNDRLQAQLADQASAQRGAALVIRRAAQDSPASRPFALLVPRALALLVIALIALIILAVLKVI